MKEIVQHLAPVVRLNSDQSRRAMALAVALTLVAGRAVQIDKAWALARWIETGEVQS
jgi:hypothetical protein